MRLLKLLGILALVVVAAGAGLYAWATSYLASPVPLEEPVVFMVEQGSNLRAVARDLDARGVIEHPRLWFWAARLQGQASRIHAGEYEVRPGATPGTVLKQLVDGTVVLREFTVVEGSTWRDFRRGGNIGLRSFVARCRLQVRKLQVLTDKHCACQRNLQPVNLQPATRRYGINDWPRTMREISPNAMTNINVSKTSKPIK